MNSIRYLLIMLLAMLTGVEAVAQDDFNPSSPGDPGVPPQKLTLVASPAEGGTVSGGGRYVPETVVSVTASAKADWQFVSWTDEDGNVLSTSRTYKHTKLAGPETLTANFEFNPGSPADPVPGTQLVYYKLTLKADEGGAVSGGGKYQAGTKVTLRATCDTNFGFAGWINEEGDTISTAMTFTYTTQEYAETLTAAFNFIPGSPTDPSEPIVRYTVTLTATEGGTVSGGGRQLEGAALTLRANPNTGYVFVGWYKDGELITALREFNYIVPRGNVTLEARFEFRPDSPAEPAMPTDKQYALYLMSPITYPGKDVDYQLWLSNPYQPLRDMHFNLSFPEGLTPDIQNIMLGEGVEGYTVSVAETDEPNTYAVSLLGGIVSPGNKELLSMCLFVPDTIPLGTDYQLKINQVSVTQDDNTTCTTSTRNGRVSVYKLGDTNGDGCVNILDRVNFVNYVVVGNVSEDDIILEVSDINDDGNYNVIDAVGLMEIILNE